MECKGNEGNRMNLVHVAKEQRSKMYEDIQERFKPRLEAVLGKKACEFAMFFDRSRDNQISANKPFLMCIV